MLNSVLTKTIIVAVTRISIYDCPHYLKVRVNY